MNDPVLAGVGVVYNPGPEIRASLHPRQGPPRLVPKCAPGCEFDILDVPKKTTLAKFGFMSIRVQPHCDKK